MKANVTQIDITSQLPEPYAVLGVAHDGYGWMAYPQLNGNGIARVYQPGEGDSRWPVTRIANTRTQVTIAQLLAKTWAAGSPMLFVAVPISLAKTVFPE